MKILWASKNHPTKSQISELRRLYGNGVQVDIFDKPYVRPSDIVQQFKRGQYDEMVLIATLAICRQVVDYGYKPLYAEMTNVSENEQHDVVLNNREKNNEMRYMRFVKFKRLEGIKLIFSELKPLT